MVRQGGVLFLPDRAAGADVDRRRGHFGDVVEEAMMRLCRDGVCLHHAQRGIDDDTDFGAHPVSDPAQANVLDRRHTRRAGQGALGGANERGIHCVHQTAIDVAGRALEHDQDRDRG